MTTVGATRARDSRGYWRISWLAVVNGEEIQGVKFATREEAIEYAKRVAAYQNETIRDYRHSKRKTDE